MQVNYQSIRFCFRMCFRRGLLAFCGLLVLFCSEKVYGQINYSAAGTQRGGFQPLPADAAGIHAVQFSVAGNQMAYAIMDLGQSQGLELDFDDFDPRPKVYNYTFLLCDEHWQPVLLSPFDYLKGFNQARITDYKYSSVARTKYLHYKAVLPNNQCMPIKSGNYLLKVFLEGDTSKLAFERRMLVVDPKVSIAATVRQPADFARSAEFQKVQFSIDVSRLHVQNPLQQVKVVVLQNERWDNAVHHLQPAFMRGSIYEYNGERDLLFESGKEYRWVDLQSFRFQSERIAGVQIADSAAPYQVEVKTDISRQSVQYMPYADYNGFFKIASSEHINPWWQGDYGWVRFSYRPQDGQPLIGKQLYILGQMNGYRYDGNSLMQFDPAKGLYEKTLLLKQGFYSYLYATKSTDGQSSVEIKSTEGNYWETENDYTILVYYQSYSDRAPQLVGCATINSRK